MTSAERPFRFGVNLITVADRQSWLDGARQVEDLGYDILLVPDHLGFPSPFPALVAAAGVTDHIRLGTCVLNAGFYNPTILARDVATADLTTDGRIELGLGTGYVRAEFEKAGLPFESAGKRVAHLRTIVETVYGHLDDYSYAPRPTQSHVPLFLAGNGDKMLRLAAERADIVGFTGASTDRDGTMSLNSAADLEERVRFARDAAGARADDIEWNLLVQKVVVTEDREQRTAELHAEYAPGLSVEEFAALPTVLVGTAAEIADKLLDIRARIGISNITVLENARDEFAAVIDILRR
ncbi:TIGR03621 family F420-dependent LLM class oxidoreductase [Williamsia maris]|uniref:F420-dependent oxidoreductase, MSMEG_2516 family n=1 Tax=Williamsia maris TaxID=72806 RepID=A0ABT1HCB6_9NOCA|nr:TIGR03621 family F420-dependent LLM class oxidoreductase [Williamsia maris]MCP2175308.1 putative F420-dependent oxidoreductase, MSMEG_2516 family [Williamsia maris]